MVTINHSDISDMEINDGLVSYVVLNGQTLWYRPHLTRTITSTAAQAIEIPRWVNMVGYAIIGGGGGGQTGNGGNNSSGRPGDASQWVVGTFALPTLGEDATYYANIRVGAGGDGGANSDHAHGKNGAATSIQMAYRVGTAEAATQLSASSAGGLAGPASGLPVGAVSGRPNAAYSPRAETALPRGGAAGKEAVGGIPGAGGGYGGGGFFGARGRGAAGGRGRAMIWMYSA